MAYIRKVKTKSKATAVQIIHKAYGRIVRIEHPGSAHTPAELNALMTLAQKRLFSGQPSLFPETRLKTAALYTISPRRGIHLQYVRLLPL